jgi:hypothetical protein
MKIKKFLLIALPVIVLTGAGFGWYQYNKPQQDVAELSAESVTATHLFKDFMANEMQANKAYLNKALKVSGKVLEVKQNQQAQLQVILDTGDPMFGIACTLDHPSKPIKSGDNVTIKGICTGYLNDVVLIKSLLLQ